MSVTATQARKMAKFWADILREGQHELQNGSGDPFLQAGTALLVARDRLESPHPPELIDAFERQLETLILEGNHRYVYSEYAPCIVLEEAAKAVGLVFRVSDMPWKTGTTAISDDKVIANRGYKSLPITL